MLNVVVLLFLTGRGIPKLPHRRVVWIGFPFPSSKRLYPLTTFLFSRIKKQTHLTSLSVYCQETLSQNQLNHVIGICFYVPLGCSCLQPSTQKAQLAQGRLNTL